MLSRNYEDRQRNPDDLEAQEGQRTIAVHALETLATSDTGIAMLRRLLREQVKRLCQGNRLAWERDRRYADAMAEISYTPAPLPRPDSLRPIQQLGRSRGRKSIARRAATTPSSPMSPSISTTGLNPRALRSPRLTDLLSGRNVPAVEADRAAGLRRGSSRLPHRRARRDRTGASLSSSRMLCPHRVMHPNA